MQGGGAERVAALLCNQWVEAGYQVTLMPTFSGKGVCSYPLHRAIHLDYLADHIKSSRKTPWSMFQRLWILRNYIKTKHIDVVVSFLTHVNVAAILATRGLSTPIIVSERTHPPAMPLGLVWRVARKLTYRKANCVIAQTQKTASWLQKHCCGSKLRVIPNPVIFPLPRNEPIRNPLSYFPDNQHLIIAVGRLDQYKNFGQIIAAFSPLSHQHPNWHLVICGEGDQRESLALQREQLGLLERVHLLGHVGNLGDWYHRADCYVMTSKFEGFPNTLLEAMSYRLPPISLDCNTGPRDIIKTGKNGFLLPINASITELSHALETLITNKTLRLQMGNEASKVCVDFSMQKIATLWDEVLNSHHASRR